MTNLHRVIFNYMFESISYFFTHILTKRAHYMKLIWKTMYSFKPNFCTNISSINLYYYNDNIYFKGSHIH